MGRLEIAVVVAGAVAPVLTAVVIGVWTTMPPDIAPDALPSSWLGPPPDDHRQAVEEGRATARSLLAEEKLPGLSLAVAVDGEIVWAESFGWANLETQAAMTPGTLFRIGNVSMAFTAAAAGLLSERGRLDLDAPVQQYVPDFPEKQWPISTRQLLAHTAGIQSTIASEEGVLQTETCPDDAARLVFFADAELKFGPGTEYDYSSYGWVLVGAVIAGAAGEPYLGFMRREIFMPMGMEHTVPDIIGRVPGDRAPLYYPRLMLNPRYGLLDGGAGDLSCLLPAVGFLSTPSDLVRFGSAIMNRTSDAFGWEVRSLPLGAGGQQPAFLATALETL